MIKIKHYCNLDGNGLTFAVFVCDSNADPDNIVVLKRGLSKQQMRSFKLKLRKMIGEDSVCDDKEATD